MEKLYYTDGAFITRFSFAIPVLQERSTFEIYIQSENYQRPARQALTSLSNTNGTSAFERSLLSAASPSNSWLARDALAREKGMF